MPQQYLRALWLVRRLLGSKDAFSFIVFTIDESFFSPTFCFRNQRVDLESWSGIVRGADVREVTPKIFESGGDNDPIKMFKIYAEKRPLDFSGPEDPFYLVPRTISSQFAFFTFCM
jgi:hypothetical protein